LISISEIDQILIYNSTVDENEGRRVGDNKNQPIIKGLSTMRDHPEFEIILESFNIRFIDRQSIKAILAIDQLLIFKSVVDKEEAMLVQSLYDQKIR